MVGNLPSGQGQYRVVPGQLVKSAFAKEATAVIGKLRKVDGAAMGPEDSVR